MPISGVKVKKDTKGRPLSVTFNLKKMNQYKHIVDVQEIMEDLSDHITILERRGDPTYPAAEVFAELDKKHGFKRK